MRTRTLGWTVALGAAVLALRPIGPFERVADLALVPARLTAPLGVPSRLAYRARQGGIHGGDADVLALEADLSLELELAVLRSAEPRTVAWPIEGVVPVAGEVDVRVGTNRDRISLRVSDPQKIRPGQAVVAGDVYVGHVEKIPFDRPYRDRPGLFERGLRRLGLSSPPVPPPRDLVIVRLITDPEARVGGLIVRDQEGESCRLVVGGLARRSDRVWLAVHNPESQQTNAGRVLVHEPVDVVDSPDSIAEGFLIGDFHRETLRVEGEGIERELIGVEPLVDFESGLNQVLVLTEGTGAAAYVPGADDVVRVLDASGWRGARMVALGDASPWRSTGRLDHGRNGGVRGGAAVVDGVRLVGRVVRSDQLGASVALLDDPGFRVSVLAQSVAEPGATPLVLGSLESQGRDDEGLVVMRWSPLPGSRHAEWMRARAGGDGAVDVRLWTGSGMSRVPRGLLLGRTTLVAPDTAPDGGTGAVRLALTSTGDPSASLAVRTGGARLVRGAQPAPGIVQAAEVDR